MISTHDSRNRIKYDSKALVNCIGPMTMYGSTGAIKQMRLDSAMKQIMRYECNKAKKNTSAMKQKNTSAMKQKNTSAIKQKNTSAIKQINTSAIKQKNTSAIKQINTSAMKQIRFCQNCTNCWQCEIILPSASLLG